VAKETLAWPKKRSPGQRNARLAKATLASIQRAYRRVDPTGLTGLWHGRFPFVQITGIHRLLQWVHGPGRLVCTKDRALPTAGADRADATLAELLGCGLVIQGDLLEMNHRAVSACRPVQAAYG